jgi:hypothetical protein
MTSRRTVVTEVQEFAESWRTGGSCPASHYTPLVPDLTEWDRSKCREYFVSSGSNLKPCFDVVSPVPFLDMCRRQSEYAKTQPSASEGFCQVTSAYIELCKLNSVELRLPGECYSCQAAGRPVERGGGFTNYFNSSAPRSADVTFVVQQGGCLQDLRLDTVLRLVESSLLEVGVKGNQYSVVGYGGQGELQGPVAFTAASRLFSGPDTVRSALSRLDTANRPGTDLPGRQVHKAITFAARMPTRAAVSSPFIICVLFC